jgi:hypothetical protein
MFHPSEAASCVQHMCQARGTTARVSPSASRPGPLGTAFQPKNTACVQDLRCADHPSTFPDLGSSRGQVIAPSLGERMKGNIVPLLLTIVLWPLCVVVLNHVHNSAVLFSPDDPQGVQRLLALHPT